MAITCPWCGTNYLEFQSNCSNCGGILPLQELRQTRAGVEIEIPTPPPAPRVVPNGYFGKLLTAEVTPIIGIIFIPLGSIFFIVGLILLFIFWVVGLPFTLVGFIFLAVGIPLLISGYSKAQGKIEVLRTGNAVEGEIIDVRQDYTRSVNNRHPWVIEYGFKLDGRFYEGELRALMRQLPDYIQPDAPAYILYNPSNPNVNTLFPPLR